MSGKGRKRSGDPSDSTPAAKKGRVTTRSQSKTPPSKSTGTAAPDIVTWEAVPVNWMTHLPENHG